MEEDEIDTEETAKEIRNFYNRLKIEHLLIILLLMLMLLMYVLHTKEIDKCIIFYENILRNQTLPIIL